MKKNPEFIVKTESELLTFLLECFRGKSRNYVKGILKRGQITVNGKVCKDYARAIYPGQKIGARLYVLPEKEKMSLPILYEDSDIIVVDKPAGLLSVSTEEERENTAYHIVNEYVKKQTRFGRVFIVHRLDRETSGVLLLAKNEQTKFALQENWDENVIRRGYIAVVEGKPEPPQNRITSWLKQTKTLLVYSSNKKDDGKMAVTDYRTLQSVTKTAEGRSDEYSLLDVSIETGRKNQIRVHMKDIDCPVAGDKKYGAATNPFERLGLHASELVVKHPATGEEMRFESPIPKAFKRIFAETR